MNIVAARSLKRLTASFIAFAVLSSMFLFVPATLAAGPPSAEITVRSGPGSTPVQVNGEATLSGRSFFPPGLIETSETSSADLNLNKLGKISLSPASALDLSFFESEIAGKLLSGKVRIAAPKGVSLRIETPDNVFTNDPRTSTVFTLDLTSGASIATTETGTVVTATGEPAAKQTTSGGNSIWIPLAIWGGAVGAAVITVLMARSDDDLVVSPIR